MCAAGADLRRRLAQLCLLVGVEPLLGARRALSSVQRLEAAPQAGVAQSAVAPAVAWQLIGHIALLRCLLIDVYLPGIPEVLARELAAGQDRRQRANLERSRGVVGRDIIG